MGGDDLRHLAGHFLGMLAPIAEDHQVRHAGAQQRRIMISLQFPHLPAQLRFDLPQRHDNAFLGHERRHHRFLQTRPSGSMMRSASIGPQVPH